VGLQPEIATPITYGIDEVQNVTVLSGNRESPAPMFTFAVAPGPRV